MIRAVVREGFPNGAAFDAVLITFKIETSGGLQPGRFRRRNLRVVVPELGFSIEVNPTGIDVTAMDAIGWNLVPEPGTALLLLGALAFAAARRRRD